VTTAAALLVILTTASHVAAPSRQSTNDPRRLTAEEVQVVIAALDKTALPEARSFSGKPLAIMADTTLAICGPTTSRWCIREPFPSQISNISRDRGASRPLTDIFQARNATASVVTAIVDRVVVAAAQEIEDLFQRGRGWSAFHNRFGRAPIIRFSAPAIAGDEAVVYVTFICGELCGKSWLVSLEKQDGPFRVRKVLLLAIA